MELFNADRKMTERIGQIYILNGRDRAVGRTNCAAATSARSVKLKDTHTGNTLCARHAPVKLPKVEYPQPTIHAALCN